MCICELINKDLTKMNEEELFELHYEISSDISFLAREAADIQSNINALHEFITGVEDEIDSRNSKLKIVQ